MEETPSPTCDCSSQTVSKGTDEACAAAAAKPPQSCPTVRPHRRQPTGLLCPWDSPGNNTGVGRHFLLQCMKVKSESEVAQSCLTLRDPMDYSLPCRELVIEWCLLMSTLKGPAGLHLLLQLQNNLTQHKCVPPSTCYDTSDCHYAPLCPDPSGSNWDVTQSFHVPRTLYD